MGYRQDFPIFAHADEAGQPYLYLDNASSTQTPQAVIDAVTYYYTHCGSNVHRGNYKRAELTSILYDQARRTAAEWLNVHAHEIIFTKGTTDGLNFLAELLELQPSDTVVNCIHEHHANFLPWYARAQLRTIPIDTNGLVDLALLEAQLQHSPKLISISWASNVTGNLQPIQDIVALAHRYNCLVCIDGAQIVGHRTVDLGKLEPDFFVCSSHKMFGPTGAGLLYIHEKHLDTLPYTRLGGGMVNAFDGKHCQFKRAPLGFEPGTPAIEAIFGFAKAIAYIQSIGYERIQQHCQQWSGAFMQQLDN